MLKYELKKMPNKPLYESLYEAIRSDILHGKLRAGIKLPSKRDMAADNQISLTTVMNAYQQLLMEGYIISEEKKGYFVAHLHAMRPVEREKTDYIKYYKEETWFADFKANNTLYHFFPFSTWKKVLREILTEYEMELVTRGNPYGLEELRVQIANYLYRVRGINVSPECVVIGAGIEYLYSRLITLFGANDIYAIENPGYKKISKIYEAYNLRWKSIAMEDNGISMLDIRVKDINIAHVSPEHHYPLGTTMPMSRRQELLDWANESDAHYIIEDDFDCEFRYNTRPIPALKSMDSEGKVIYMNTFSKTISPAVRVSYMVLPEHLMQKYINKTHFFTNSTSSLEQYAVARFIEKGYYERHINRIKKYYRQEGEQLLKLIRENKDIPVKELSEGDSGTHILVKLDTDLSDTELKRRAMEKGIHFSCLTDFCTEYVKKYEHTMVLNFSDLDAETQKEAIRRIGEIFV